MCLANFTLRVGSDILKTLDLCYKTCNSFLCVKIFIVVLGFFPGEQRDGHHAKKHFIRVSGCLIRVHLYMPRNMKFATFEIPTFHICNSQ